MNFPRKQKWDLGIGGVGCAAVLAGTLLGLNNWGVLLLVVAIVIGGTALERKRQEPHEPSEFGSGIVICLAKFSEHLGEGAERNIRLYDRWVKDGAKGEPPPECRYVHIYAEVTKEADKYANAIARSIEFWMNAASDHMYQLSEDAPQPLRDLAELTLEMGHGFSGKLWTMEDVDEMRKLWRLSCVALDRRLRVPHDWGEW